MADLVRAEARALFHGHRKLEMNASAIAASLSAFLVAAAVYVFGSVPAGIPYGAIFAGLVAAILGMALTLSIIYGYYRFVEAPSNLYLESTRNLVELQQRLETETAKNAKPTLEGKIICLEISSTVILKFTEEKNDCFLTFFVKATNATVPTMVSRWQLDLLWEGIEYPSVRGSVKGYYVNRYYAHARDSETKYETLTEALTEFPNDEEITNTNYKAGWLRFCVGSLPSEALAGDCHLRQEATLRLIAFDSKDDPHLIYEGTTKGLAGCGKIEWLDPATDKQKEETAVTDPFNISFELTGLNYDRYGDGVKSMLPRFKYKTAPGYSPRVEVKANIRIFDDSSMRMHEFPGVWHRSKVRHKKFSSGDSGDLLLGLVRDEGIVACEYNVIKTLNGADLSPNLTELDGKRFYILVVFIMRTDKDIVLPDKRQWFGIVAGPEPRYTGLVKQPPHLL